jgi:RNA polymerase sigma factor (TIGR02999 family)
MSDVTRIMSQIEQGDPQAAEQLLPLVYDELRKLAAARLAQEKPGQTLGATSLVHEAYIRLLGDGADQTWDGRGHFFAAAAEAMRRIVVENARRKSRQRHGGEMERVDLNLDFISAHESYEKLLALNDALSQLEGEDSQAAQVVKLRYFAGFTVEQTAAALGISVRTVNRHWAFARAWLFQQLA